MSTTFTMSLKTVSRERTGEQRMVTISILAVKNLAGGSLPV